MLALVEDGVDVDEVLLDDLVGDVFAEDAFVEEVLVGVIFFTGFFVTARVALFALAWICAPDLAMACKGCGRRFGFFGTLLSAGNSATRVMIAV